MTIDPVRVLITGSRELPAVQRSVVRLALIEATRAVLATHRRMVLVHGDALGVDRYAAYVAASMGARTEPHPADRQQYGKGAGHLRNLAMVEAGADVCLAFPRSTSRGTWHCIRAAANVGILVRIYPLPEVTP